MFICRLANRLRYRFEFIFPSRRKLFCWIFIKGIWLRYDDADMTNFMLFHKLCGDWLGEVFRSATDRFFHKANNPAASAFVRFRTIADIDRFWRGVGCPLMTLSDIGCALQ